MGYVHVYTGEGKGKTTAALGLAFRAIGNHQKVRMVQFLKGTPTSELETARLLTDYMIIQRFGNQHKFYWELSETEKATYHQLVQPELANITKIIEEGQAEIIILDEIFAAIRYNLVSTELVLKWMKMKSPMVELVLTGRDVPQVIIDEADLVTSMTKIKHYYDHGVIARKGIEF